MSGIIGVSPDMRSGVVGRYPAGHVIKHWNIIRSSGGAERNQTVTSTKTIVNLNGALTITGVTAIENNYLRLTWGGMGMRLTADETYASYFDIFDGSNILSEYEYYFDTASSDQMSMPITLMNIIVVPASFSNKTVSLRVWFHASNPGTGVINARNTGVVTAPFLSIDEIQA